MEKKTTTAHVTFGDKNGRQHSSTFQVTYSSEAERREKTQKMIENEKKKWNK
jgi:hypothetical protein